jgi:hypothetical protein
MPIVESRKKDGIHASVEIFEYLLNHCYSNVDEISKATGYNNATVSKVIHSVLNPIISGRADYKGEGEEKRYKSLYSIDTNKLLDISVLTDILMHLNPLYMPEGLKKSLERYVTPIIKDERRKWKKEKIAEELREIIEGAEKQATRLKEQREGAEERLKRVLERA